MGSIYGMKFPTSWLSDQSALYSIWECLAACRMLLWGVRVICLGRILEISEPATVSSAIVNEPPFPFPPNKTNHT